MFHRLEPIAICDKFIHPRFRQLKHELGGAPCQVILNPLLRKPRHFCRAYSRHPRVGQHRLSNLPRSIGQAIRQQENLSCFLTSFLTSRLVFFGCLATDGMDDRPVSHVSPRARTHAGTELATDQPVISSCTRPRPAGGKEEFANSTLRVRGRTRVRGWPVISP